MNAQNTSSRHVTSFSTLPQRIRTERVERVNQQPVVELALVLKLNVRANISVNLSLGVGTNGSVSLTPSVSTDISVNLAFYSHKEFQSKNNVSN
jgi:hypothetical protein